jgi:hypothetical protein
MTTEERDALLWRVERAVTWTLDGGNDPEDPGDTRQAVRELAGVLTDLIRAFDVASRPVVR